MAPSAVLDLTLPTSSVLDLTSKLTKASTRAAVQNAHTQQVGDLDTSKLVIIRNLNPKLLPAVDSPEVWGMKVTTDHMLTCTWTESSGWAAPEIKPYGPLSIMPTASVLHYATECFEGLKAYRGHDGRLRLFRPERNCVRMLKSATRVALPAFSAKELLKLIERFVAIEGPKWLPNTREWRGQFLYLRPTMIGTGAALGVQKPSEAMLFIVAAVFPPLDKPHREPRLQTNQLSQDVKRDGESVKETGMKLLGSSHDTIRAWPGGFGCAKLGANYGPTLVAQQEAKKRGYDQVLWLFGDECYVTEAGAANFFVLWRTREGGKPQLVTAPLGSGTILDGITRASVLDIVRAKLPGEVEVVERSFTMTEVAEAADQGRLLEAFCCGTAFFLRHVSEIHFRGRDVMLPLGWGEEVKYTPLIKGWLKDIMFGDVQHEWAVVVEEEPAVSADPSPAALDRANEACLH